ncbi:hypothetical protein N9H08_01065 [bacterium]|nr:hypothetical protein [bacterium]
MFLRNMKAILIVVFFAQLQCVLLAQNNWLRMQPEHWFELETVQEGWRQVKQDTGAYWSESSFNRSRLSMVAGSEGVLFRRGDDLRLVFDSTGHNLSNSHNLSFNHMCKEFFWNGRCYALGGWGYWNYHSHLIEFVSSTGEWELQVTDSAPDHVIGESTFWDSKSGSVVAIDETAKEAEDGSFVRGVYRLNMGGDWIWELEGQVNPLLLYHLSMGQVVSYDFKDFFIWVSKHKSIILRKEDMSCVLTEVLNRGMLNGPHGKLNALPSNYFQMSTKDGVLTQRYWDEKGGLTLERSWDIAQAFEESKESPMPLSIPVSFKKASTTDDTEDNSNVLVSVVFAMMLGGFGFYLGKNGQKPQPREASATEEDNIKPSVSPTPDVGKVRLSDLTQEFLALEASSLDTLQLNALLSLTDDLSEETKRARRAQAIRKVNAEYDLLFGQSLIVRTKDKLDRRRTIYIIQRHSGSA